MTIEAGSNMINFIRSTLILLYLTIGAVVLPAYAAEKSPDQWIVEANQILKVDAQDAKAYYNRGTGHYRNNDYDAAVNDLSMAIYFEPKSPDAYFNRGLSRRRQHQIDEAVSDFSKAIKLYPNHPGYYFERCNALIVKSDFDGAVADCSEAIRLSPNEAEAYFVRGVAHMLRGDIDGAWGDSFHTLQIQPDHSYARRLLYEILVRREALIGAHHPSAPHNPYLASASKEI